MPTPPSPACSAIPTDLARLRPTLSRGLVDLIHRLLARNPNRRPATGADLRAELLRLAGEPPSTLDHIDADRRGLPGQPPLRRTRRRLDPARPRRTDERSPPGRSPAKPPRRGRRCSARSRESARPTAGPRLRGRPARDMQTRFAPSFVVICLLLAIGIVVSLVLWATIRPDDPESADVHRRRRRPAPRRPTTAAAAVPRRRPAEPSQIATLASFDPRLDGGNGEEHDDLLDERSPTATRHELDDGVLLRSSTWARPESASLPR